jgi:hypothetical protein
MVAAAHGPASAQRAARLFGAAAALRDAITYVLSPEDQQDYAAWMQAVRSHLEPPSWEAAWTEGEAMSLDEALAYAASDDPT